MVSIRYFCGVGEFCRTKSTPRGGLTSNTGAPRGALGAIVAIVAMTTRARAQPECKILPDIDLEKELDRKLNQPRIRSRSRAGNNSEVGVICRAAGCIRRSELCAIKQIEELHPRFNSSAAVRSEHQLLEDGKVEIIHAVRSESQIDPRLVAKSEIARSCEARGVEPSVEARCALSRRITTRDDVRP